MVKEAIAFNKKNRNTLWQDTIEREVKNEKIAYEKASNDYQYVKCHMLFDIKMEDFQVNACLVVGGHMTHTPGIITYSSVVTRENVHIGLTMAASHDLEIKAANALNAYMMALNIEKIWTVIGLEFGDDAGKSAIIARWLYCLKSVDASFRAHLSQCIQKLGYKSCDADPDLWMKAVYRPEDTLEVYSYILCYVCLHYNYIQQYQDRGIVRQHLILCVT